MKNLSLILFFFLFSLSLDAQKNIKEDIPFEAKTSLIHFKDGGKLKGEIIDENEKEVRLNLGNKQEISFAKDRIKKIIYAKDLFHLVKSNRYIKTSGNFMTVKFSTAFPYKEQIKEIVPDPNLDISFNRFFKKKLSVGLGLGLHLYTSQKFVPYSFIPVYANLRYFPITKGISPYVSLSAGYGLGLDFTNSSKANGDYSGGPFINPSIGIRFASKMKTKAIIGLGYRFQYTAATFTETLNQTTSGAQGENITFVEKIFFKRFEISIGFMF